MGGVFVASTRGVEEEEDALASQDMCMRYRTDLANRFNKTPWVFSSNYKSTLI